MIYGDVAREYKMQIYYIVQRIFWFYQGIIVLQSYWCYSTMICSANQWIGFYMITASVMKELKPTRKTLSSIRSEYCIPNWKGYSTENYKKRRKIL